MDQITKGISPCFSKALKDAIIVENFPKTMVGGKTETAAVGQRAVLKPARYIGAHAFAGRHTP